jgi:hypothetical protein
LNKFKSDMTLTPITLRIVESAEKSTGVLAIIEGESFAPDGFSRNKRFYSKKLWDNVIASDRVKKKLNDRNMYGAIGHDVQLTEESLRNGLFSHIVTDITIDGKKGNARFEVLDTPTGKILEALARAKCTLYVSSRADGAFDGYDADGNAIVSEEDFIFHTFDFVLDPGIESANPKLREMLETLQSLGEQYKKQQTSNGGNMNLEEMLNKSIGEKAVLQSELTEAKTQIAKLGDVSTKLEEASVKIAKLEVDVKTANDSLTEANKSVALLVEYKDIGTPTEIKGANVKAAKLIREYKEIGTPAEITEVNAKAAKVITEYREVGASAKVIKETNEKVYNFIKKYAALGTPTKIAKVMESVKKNKEVSLVEKLTKELGVSEAKLRAFGLNRSEVEIKEFFTGLSESIETKQKYRNDEKKATLKDGEKPFFNRESSTQKLMEQFSKK